jgi:imidazole glycerol phosphate synthase glutamine amidotransferase subunit
MSTSTKYKEVDFVTAAGGNIGSVSRCLERLGVPYRECDAQSPPDGSRPIVLPGVGAFGTVMQALEAGNLAAKIKELVLAGTPFLGVCVGMQVLFDGSEEAPGVNGLGLIAGQVRKYQHGKVPQIGWNKIVPGPAAEAVEDEKDRNNSTWPDGFVYFVNSYYPHPDNGDVTLYSANYYGDFCAAVHKGNITAFQFHPEKSGDFGQSLIEKWVADVS